MKRKIISRLVFIGGLSILLTAIFTTLAFYNLFQRQVQADLKNEGQILAHSYSLLNENQILHKLKPQELRITLISPTGLVLYESDANVADMDNHRTRPEIAKALESGVGEAIRHSDTLGKNTFYYAHQLESGNVLRVAKQAHNIWTMFAGVFPSVIGLALLIFLLSLILSHLLTKTIIEPIEKMAEDMEHLEDNLAYEELAPFAKIIKEQSIQIRQQLEHLEQENTKLQLIMENMSEGIIILNTNKNILTINPSAISLLSAKPRDYIGQNILYFSRFDRLNTCVEHAFEGVSESVEIQINGKVIQAFVNPVYNKGQLIGVLCFVLDITERKKNEKVRQEFTANVSHELKTPLTSISGYAELIENRVAKQEDTIRFASKIHHEAKRLLLLIDNIIKLSQLDEPRENADFEHVDLLEVTHECVDSLSLYAQKREVSFSIDGQNCIVFANREMMEELIYNLCDNAIRYNKTGGTVTVTLKPSNDFVTLTVKDTGIGIHKKYHDRIFERFYRVDKSRSKATGGTGLGLAIVKHIVQQHNGKITVESTEGIGTEISILLPAYT